MVYRYKHLLLCFLCSLISLCTIAQEDDGDPLAPDPLAIKESLIPTDTLIRVKLMSRDTGALDYYSLYAFEYVNNKEKYNLEFIVPKKDDVYRNKMIQPVDIKLCKVTRFVNSWNGIASAPIEIGDYIEITRTNGKDKQYFNFDTSLPHAVYTVCDTKEQNKDKR